jgi:4-amino-4-deoxy-L-arabinose transferase-like glycosyltransferase
MSRVSTPESRRGLLLRQGTLRLPPGLIACILVACVANVIWIQRNAAPPRSWDDAEYLAESVATYHALERGDLTEFLRMSSRPARGAHPPMAKLFPITAYVLVGPGTGPALYANTILIPVFCVYVFLLATEITRKERAAIFAVAVTCSFPLTFGLWRLVMADFGLAVAVVASHYHLLRCTKASARRGWHAILAGTFIGWGMLWKISAPVFVVGPLCYVLVRSLADAKDSQRQSNPRILLWIAAAGLVVAGPFYFWRIGSLWDFVFYSSRPEPSIEQFSLGPVFSPATVLKYWLTLIDFGISGYFAIVLAGLVIAQLVRRERKLPLFETWFLAACGLPPLVFFTFQYLKEPRHLFAAFATLGILIAALLEHNIAKISSKSRLLVVTAVFAFPAYQFLVLSFNSWPAPSRDVRLGPILLLAADRESLFVRPADSTAWPVADVVRLLATHSKHIRDRAPRVRVVGHVPFLDGPTLNYESLLNHRQSLTYSMLEDFSLNRRWWDFVVVIHGPVRLKSEYREPVLQRVLEDQRLPFSVVGRVALPEGREAVVYRAGDGEPPPRTVGENYVTATNRHGSDLFSVSRVQWELPSGRSDIVTTRGDKPIEFQYIYVPDSVRSLRWNVVKNPQAACTRSEYAVEVFDLNSRRGPARTVSKVFSVPPNQSQQVVSVDVDEFRDQIITIRLSPSFSAGTSGSCVGWSDLRLVADAARPL